MTCVTKMVEECVLEWRHVAHLPRVKRLLVEFSLLLAFSVSHLCAAAVFAANGSMLLLILSLGSACCGFWFCFQRFCQVNAALASLRGYALYQSRMLEQLTVSNQGADSARIRGAVMEFNCRCVD